MLELKLKDAAGQELKKDGKSGGKLCITGKEKKPDEENQSVSFTPYIDLSHFIKEGELNKKDKVFLLICALQEENDKGQGSGKYHPVLKTECRQ